MRCADLEPGLAALAAGGSLRQRRVLAGAQGVRVEIDGRAMLSFASNDYLGLAAHPEIAAAACAAAQTYGVGAGASHLLSGHHALHDALETRFAAMVGAPAALLFSTGYMANLGVVTALLGRHDALFADKLNHASLVDAARLSGADHQRYHHNDMADLARRLAASTAPTKLIAVDAVFSMDGDTAPLAELLALAERYDAWLLQDDAHGFGVLSLAERGVTAMPERLLYLATFGKAAGVAGAAVAGSANAVAWLVNRARTYIYTTAQPPLLAAATLKSLDLIAQADDRRAHLRALIAHLQQRLAGLPWRLMPSVTPIQPLLVGDNATAVRLSQALAERGIWLPAIRPPTVPEGTARLRISLSAAHGFDGLDALADALWGLAT
ncbi:MAG: 8-amino-7-oxononanoate synthase [Betaproteobacteria bacterium]|nr:MAG: 8-amino-7-oxononanoate synthase [Betaproteobacteria bacterium]